MASSMSKRCRDSDPGDGTAESAELKTVYVDTSLGTHLAVLVRSSDTVSDFKQRVATEHKQCFPEVGEIQVHSVKVKRKANYYHLPDVILVWSAFLVVKKNWFLSVDASNIPICLSIKDSSELGTSSGVKTVMTNKDDDGRGLIFDANMKKILPLALLGSAAEENSVSDTIVEPKVIKPVEKTTDSPRSIYSEEHYVGIKSPVKKKRKVRHTKDNYSLEGVDSMVCPNGNDWKPNMSNLAVKASNARNNQFDTEGRLVSDICMADGKGLSLEDDPEGIIPSNNKAPEHVGQDLVLKEASLLLDVQKSSFSDGRKEDNALESRMDSEPDQDAPTMHVEDVCINIPDMDGGGGSSDVNTDVKKKKKKKKKVPKAATESQGTTDMEQIRKDERIKPSTDYMAEGKGLSLGDDPEGIIPSNNKAPEYVGPDLALKEASLLLDAQKSSFSDGRKEDNALESKMGSELDQDAPTMHIEGVCNNIPDFSAALMDGGGGSRDVNTDVKKKKKKKKKVLKTATEFQDTTDMEQIGKDERIMPSTDYMEETKGLSLEYDHEGIIPSNNKAPEHVGPDLALKEASLMLDAQKSIFSDGRKEDNALESKMDSELDQDVPTVHVEGVIPDFSAALMDGGGCSRDVNTDVKKKKKKKKVKKTAIVQDTTTRDVGLTGNGEMKNTHETIRAGENGLSLGHDNKVTPPSDSKAPDHVYPDLAMKEASIIQDADDEMEPQISSCIKQKKKKRLKKSVINMENSGIAEIHSIRSSLDRPSSSGTGKKESIGLNDGKDVEMVLDASNHDAQENIWDVNRKEADLVETQTEQTLEDVSIGNKMMTEKTRSSADDCYAETENTIMKSNHTDKVNENTENRHTKSKKKKKQRRTVTDVQENLPVENQKVGSELLATKPTSVFADSELDGRYVDSSQVLSRKSEEKVDEKHEPVLNTDGHAENSGKSGDGINFKSYFVADQLQNKVDSSDKVRKATCISTKAKSNDLPSVNIPAELENSAKSSENEEPENNSYREEGTVRTVYDSVHNSDPDEMSPNSLKRSSETTEKEVKGSSPELCAMTSEKPDDIVTGSSLLKKIPSLDKLSSERSETLHNNDGNERPLLDQNTTSVMPMKTPKKKISLANSGAILRNKRRKESPMLGQNATNLLVMKTPKKKISLAKSGAIFQDNSGESSGDENGTMHSDDRTLSPSESSSTFGDSAGENELSQNSINNGCNDAKEKSSSKFDLSATNDLTMDVILRSSKRFKKAKQLASQNDTEPIDFVPDSQPPL